MFGLILVAVLAFETQSELDRRIDECPDGLIGHVEIFRRIAEIERHGEAVIIDLKIIEPVLHHHGHFLGVALAQPVGKTRVRMGGVEGDEEVMRARQSGDLHAGQHILNEAAHGPMHQFSVVDLA